MNYQNHTAVDFALDEHFQQWVLAPDEKSHSFWDTWVLQHPEKVRDIEEARQLIHALHFKTDVLPDERRQQMHALILQAVTVGESPVVSHPAVGQHQRFTLWMRVAAILIMGVLGLAGILFWYTHRQTTYTTAYGETRTVMLPDHSKVILNAHSTVHFRPEWSPNETREVWLEGEAFFEVAKQKAADRPVKFQVHTEDLTVEVLGTKFNVIKRDEHTAVTLNEGKVRLSLKTDRPTPEVVMQPGEMVTFSETNQKMKKVVVKAEDNSSWTKNYWVLDNTSLADIAQRLQATYGYTVEIRDTNLLPETMTGVLPTKNIRQLLEVLATTYNVRIQRVNNRIIIDK